MCDPMTILTATSLAVTIGSTVAGHKAQNKAAEENKIEALKSLRLQERDIAFRQQEEQKSFAQAVNEATAQQLETEGQARAAAAESGVTGMSVDLLLGDVERQGAEYKESLREQAIISIEQLQRMKAGATAQAQSRINQVPRSNPFLTGLRIAGQVAGAAGQYAGSRPPPNNQTASAPAFPFITRGALP